MLGIGPVVAGYQLNKVSFPYTHNSFRLVGRIFQGLWLVQAGAARKPCVQTALIGSSCTTSYMNQCSLLISNYSLDTKLAFILDYAIIFITEGKFFAWQKLTLNTLKQHKQLLNVCLIHKLWQIKLLQEVEFYGTKRPSYLAQQVACLCRQPTRIRIEEPRQLSILNLLI